VASTNGAVGTGAAASWAHEFLKPFEISGEGWTGRDLPGRFERGGLATRGTKAAAEGRFGALLLGAIPATVFGTEAERGFRDWGDIGADVTAADLADEGVGIIRGTGASVFSAERGGLLGDAMGGTLARDGVADGLLEAGTSCCASNEMANGEI
jgi:hypothetical protein